MNEEKIPYKVQVQKDRKVLVEVEVIATFDQLYDLVQLFDKGLTVFTRENR